MAIAVARMEDAIPLVGTAFLGGMAQSYAVRKYPEWSWALSLALMGIGVYAATKGGMFTPVGLGLATAASAGLGMALMPITTTGSPNSTGGLAGRMLTGQSAMRRVGSYPGPVRAPEFEGVRIS